MGEIIAKWLIGIEILLFLAAVIAVIFLVFRRIKIKKKETFEKRDN
ncbi:MAG: hypothetical protein K9J30_03575 [Bacteroidales bacterium]|nr:hypothetical protein [Bacteroidales bacterium]